MSRPLIGVLCCNEVAERAVQVVASRFIEPLSTLSDATVLLVPAVAHATDAVAMAGLFDGLLLTGSRSHVAAERYGGASTSSERTDPERDEVALRLADRMIEAGKPVFGICRGLQEINVLFGGSLSHETCGDRHHRSAAASYHGQFEHGHEVDLTEGGRLAKATGTRRLVVNSVHEQAVDRLGGGLTVEALSVGDDVVEAVAARPCGAEVLAVQWHPEWNVDKCVASQAFFRMIGTALHARGVRYRLQTGGVMKGH